MVPALTAFLNLGFKMLPYLQAAIMHNQQFDYGSKNPIHFLQGKMI